MIKRVFIRVMALMWTSNPVESNHVFFIVFILRNLPLLCFFSLTFLRFLRYVIFRCAKFSPQFLFFFYLINKQLLSIFFVVVDFFTLIELNWNGWCNTVMPFFFIELLLFLIILRACLKRLLCAIQMMQIMQMMPIFLCW